MATKGQQTKKAHKPNTTDDDGGTPDRPWSQEDLGGINVSHNEQKAALYLGYEDLGLFRAYLCSHLFLDYFLEWTGAGGQGMAPRAAKVFKTLSSARTAGSMETMFGR